MKKVRIGIILIVLSWLPIAQSIIIILHHSGQLISSKSEDALRLSIWVLQILIGFVGLWLVGKQAMEMSRASGWKRVPANLWHLFWSGG